MQASRITTAVTWDNFVKVAQQARQRNSGLIEKVAASPMTSAKSTLNNAGSVQQQSTGFSGILPSNGYAKSNAVVPQRILGGKFDAWA